MYPLSLFNVKNAHLKQNIMGNTTNLQDRPIEKTQKFRLLDWLTSGKKITVPIGARQLLIGSLPRRILDLKEMGFTIEGRFIEYYNSEGMKTHIKEYYMPESEIQKREEHLLQLRTRLTLHARPSKRI